MSASETTPHTAHKRRFTVAHIDLPDGLPGILGPMAFSPETARPLNDLAETLLRGPNTLTRAERELIATYTSWRNACHFCHSAHGAVAAHHLGGDERLVDEVRRDPSAAAVSPKLRALLAIAAKVQQGGQEVTEVEITRAREERATDKEIHDTVLIAAAFAMYNRYVDGLATWAPVEPDAYREAGRRLAEDGYIKAGDGLMRAPAAV
jgi:uncharacterized peroxidase-related enzyme